MFIFVPSSTALAFAAAIIFSACSKVMFMIIFIALINNKVKTMPANPFIDTGQLLMKKGHC
jgi:hypothetical protein